MKIGVAQCLTQSKHFRWRWKTNSQGRRLGESRHRGQGAWQRADTWILWRQWKVIKQQSTFDLSSLLSGISLTRSWKWTFFCISKARPVTLKRKGTDRTPPVRLHAAEHKRSLSATYFPLSCTSNGYF